MDARDALLGRRTPSHWAPDPVDAAVLDRALEAAHRAPCHRHTWPWRFLVVGPTTRARLADVAVAVKAEGGELPAAQVEAIRRGSLDPAALIVVARVEHPDPFRAREDYAAVACAVENLMLSAWADGVHAGALNIKNPWVRATVPGQANGAGYMEVDNTGSTPDRLVAVHSDAAQKVEMHAMTMENGTAQMREVDGGMEVPAGGKVTFAPGGYHLMFVKLKAPFAAGASVPVVLTFQKAGDVKVMMPVRPLGDMGHSADMGHSGHGGMNMPGMQ